MNEHLPKLSHVNDDVIFLPQYRLIIKKEIRIEVTNFTDIVHENVEAIVNRSDKHLNHDNFIAAHIIKAGGGKDIGQESSAWIATHGTLPRAGCAITSAGALKAKYVVHTVGTEVVNQQDNGGANESNFGTEELTACIINILDAADKVNAASVAMPQIWRRFYEGYEENNAKFIRCMIQTCIDWSRTIELRKADGAKTKLRYVKLTLDKAFEKTYQDQFKGIKRDMEKQTSRWIKDDEEMVSTALAREVHINTYMF